MNKTLLWVLAIFTISITIYSASAISVNNTYYEISCVPEESLIKYVGYEQICNYYWKGNTSITKDVAFCFESNLQQGNVYYFNSSNEWQNINSLFEYYYVPAFGKPACYVISGVTWNANETKTVKLNYLPNDINYPKWDTLFGNKTSGVIDLILDPVFNITHYEIGTDRSSSYLWSTLDAGRGILNVDIKNYTDRQIFSPYNVSNNFTNWTLWNGNHSRSISSFITTSHCIGNAIHTGKGTTIVEGANMTRTYNPAYFTSTIRLKSSCAITGIGTISSGSYYVTYPNVTLQNDTDYLLLLCGDNTHTADFDYYVASNITTPLFNWTGGFWQPVTGNPCLESVAGLFFAFTDITVKNVTNQIKTSSFVESEEIATSVYVKQFRINASYIGNVSMNITFDGNMSNAIYISNMSNTSNITISTPTVTNNKMKYKIYLHNNQSTLYNLSIDFTGYLLLNITFKDSETKLQIPQNITLHLIGDYSSYNYTVTNGGIELTTVPPDNYTMRYKSKNTNDYPEKFYYAELTSFAYLTLYLTNASKISNITVNVVDQMGNNVQGAVVKALRYDITTNTYLIDEIAVTDYNGIVHFSLVMNSEYYKFIVEYPQGTQVLETAASYIYVNSLTLQISTVPDIIFDYKIYNGILTNFTFNNVTNSFRFYYNDPDNVLTQACVDVYTITVFPTSERRTLFNTSCSASSSGIIYIGVSPYNGTTYQAKARGTISGVEYYLGELWHTYDEISPAGRYGLFLTGIMVLAGIFLGFWSPVAGVILAPLFLIFSRIIGLHQLSWGACLSFMALGVVIAYLISNKT